MLTDNIKKPPSMSEMLAEALRKQDSPEKKSLDVASFMWHRPEVKSLYYNGQTVKIDGYKFIACRFDNCVLQVSTDNFEFDRCVIDPSCRVEYSSNLAKVVKLFLGRFSWAVGNFDPSFLPFKNSDGSETISDGF